MGMGWHREVYPAFCRKPDGEVMFSSIRCGKNASVSVPCLTGWWLWCAATVCTWRLSAPGRRREREPADGSDNLAPMPSPSHAATHRTGTVGSTITHSSGLDV